MPGKNTIKQYVEGGIYHIYNRGVDKRKIFESKKDYIVFLRLLKEYLLPPNNPKLEALQKLTPRRIPINCFVDIELLAFCLMPNHFHLLVKQKTAEGLKNFTKALLTSYAMYFNRKYERVGPLFQDRYRAILVQNDPYLLHLSRYIHANPMELLAKDCPLQGYEFSSYPFYLGMKRCEWVNPSMILKTMSGKNLGNSYRIFVEEMLNDKRKEKETEFLGDLTLE